MRLATRYALAGMFALALLSVVGRLRSVDWSPSPSAAYLIGVVPNFAAAIAITFVLLGIWADQDGRAGRRRFAICAATSGIGLVVWEVVQRTNHHFVFDLNDIGATLLGLAVAAGVFRAMTPRRSCTG